MVVGIPRLAAQPEDPECLPTPYEHMDPESILQPEGIITTPPPGTGFLRFIEPFKKRSLESQDAAFTPGPHYLPILRQLRLQYVSGHVVPAIDRERVAMRPSPLL